MLTSLCCGLQLCGSAVCSAGLCVGWDAWKALGDGFGAGWGELNRDVGASEAWARRPPQVCPWPWAVAVGCGVRCDAMCALAAPCRLPASTRMAAAPTREGLQAAPHRRQP